jgi:hypothetical protein
LDVRIGKLSVPVYASEELAQFPAAKRAYPAASRLVEISRFYTPEVDGVLEPMYLREPHITVAKTTPGLSAIR